ncbi:MAG TPA: PAS domain-containing protein, partial [Burkholderiales bacterium]|nr:PAS domain-containing protein [Burkholderiales bacterium]
LYRAIVVAVWHGGYRSGILASVAGYLAANVLFIAPRGVLHLDSADDVARVGAYALTSLLIIALGGAMHAARRRAESDAVAARGHAARLEEEIAGHRRTREGLEHKERELQIVTDTMSAAVARCSADLRYLWVNRLYAEWAGAGMRPEDMMGRPMVDVLGIEAIEKMRPHIREVLSGRRVEYERYARRQKGRRWIRASLEPTLDESRKVTGWVAVIHDIDDSKRAADALRATQEQLEVILNTLPSGVCRTGNDLRFVWMNPVYARWIGKPAKQLVGQPVAEVLGAETMREIAPHLAKVMKGEPVQYERLASFPGLGRRWVSSVFTPILDANGHADGWVTIVTDIHDRKVNEQALLDADRRKDDFLATLAHELRNPLAPIRNAVALLGRRNTPDPEVAWSREVISRQTDQMSRLIDDLLDIERISRGKFLVRKERVPLERCIDMALEMSRPAITAAGHRLSVLLPSEPLWVEADAARLAQVFSNLLNNAAKFTGPEGEIQLHAELEGGEAVVTVEDNGIGFSPEVAPRLFRPYSQLTAGRERAGGGLGIGLSLVHGIVELHGGRVEAQSAGAGKGAMFTVRLPVARGVAEAEAGYGERPSAVPAPGLRVLVADDNRDAADSLERILTLYGYEVTVAYDGIAALRAGREFEPHFAILDIGMPGANGYEVAREMRERRGHAVTLVALTGWGQEADRRRSAEAGFDYHLTKPVDPQQINDLLVQLGAHDKNNAGGTAAAHLRGERGS